MQCNGDCFNCKFRDCIATYTEISKLEAAERKIKRIKKLAEERLNECKSDGKTEAEPKRAEGT